MQVLFPSVSGQWSSKARSQEAASHPLLRSWRTAGLLTATALQPAVSHSPVISSILSPVISSEVEKSFPSFHGSVRGICPPSLRRQSRCGCGADSKERKRSGTGGLTSQLLLLRAVRLVTSADNARHAASRHRPLHRARAQFRFRSRARTAAAIGRSSAPSLLICGERRSRNAAKLLPLSSQIGREGAGGARRRAQARKPKLSKKAA